MEKICIDGSGLFSSLNIQPVDLTLSEFCGNAILETVHKQIIQKWHGECKEAESGSATFIQMQLDSLAEDLARIDALKLPEKMKQLLKKERKLSQMYFNEFALLKADVPPELLHWISHEVFGPKRLLAYWLTSLDFDYTDSLWSDYSWCMYKLSDSNSYTIIEPPPLERPLAVLFM